MSRLRFYQSKHHNRLRGVVELKQVERVVELLLFVIAVPMAIVGFGGMSSCMSGQWSGELYGLSFNKMLTGLLLFALDIAIFF